MFSRLALPTRPTLLFQERSQDAASSKKASENGIAGLAIAMDSRGSSDTLGTERGGRTGVVLAEGSRHNPEVKSSEERDARAQERRAPGNASAAVLEGESFSAKLRQWRGEWQADPAEKLAGENKAQDPRTPDDREERLTQYYRRVLDSLVESNMITEDMASSARGKRGNDLVMAIGVVLNQAEAQKTQESRSRTQEMERQALARQSAFLAQAA